MILLIEYYRRSPVDDLDHVQLSTSWPSGRLVAEKPDRWPGTHELVPIHLHFEISWAATRLILLMTSCREILSIIFLLRASIVWSSHLCRKVCSNFKVASHLHCRIGRCCPNSCCLNLKKLLDEMILDILTKFVIAQVNLSWEDSIRAPLPFECDFPIISLARQFRQVPESV